MAILGLTRQGDIFRFVLCEHVDGTLSARKFGEISAPSWEDAIAALGEQTASCDLAIAIEPPDLSIQEVDVANLPKPAERRGAARNKAIMAGFDDKDDIRVRVDDEGNWYFAALRADLKREIERAATRAKMRIVRIENAAYCWVRFLDPRFGALVDASTGNRVAVLVVGNRRAELRVFDTDEKTLIEDIEKTFDAAVQHGFAPAISVAAVIDPAQTLGSASIGRTTLEPYAGTIPADNAGYVVPLGVAFAAAGGASATSLLDVDFAEREQINVAEIFAPIAARLPQADLLVLGAVVAFMLLLCAVQWIRGTQAAIHAASMQATIDQRAPQAAVIQAEATLVATEAKRVADADAARESGGVAARRLAQWMRNLPAGVTLESVTYDAQSGDVTVTGDTHHLSSAELAFEAINQPSSEFTQTGSTFTVQRETNGGETAAPNASPAPPSASATLAPQSGAAPAATPPSAQMPQNGAPQ